MSFAVVFTGSTRASTTIDFEQHTIGTVVTQQYAAQGIWFGPLPAGAGNADPPVVQAPPAGQAHSGSNVGALCYACEFATPRTTGTLAVPSSRVSVYVGYLGAPAICTALNPDAAGCAFVKLRAFAADGTQVAESSVRVTRGAGIHSKLSVSTATATIVGFEISGRPSIDDAKPIAIDDLDFDTPPASEPDFTLNPAATNLFVAHGSSATDPITIGRLNGSSGDIAFSVSGLPNGVTAAFTPNPAAGSGTILTLTAGPASTPVSQTATITGTPQSASAGSAARTFAVTIVVQAACPQATTAQEMVDRLAAGYTCIFVNGEIDLSEDLPQVEIPPGLTDGGAMLVIPDGVTLMGSRSPTNPGGLLAMSHRMPPQDPSDPGSFKQIMLRLGSNSRVTGLRLRGYKQLDTTDEDDPTKAIRIEGSGVLIDNNEIFGWPSAGIEVINAPAQPDLTARVTGNFIHHNVQCTLGYGIVISQSNFEGVTAGFARIDHNVFDYNRHHIASSGGAGPGYLAELNFALNGGPTCDGKYNQHFDQHGEGSNGSYDGGTAGTFIDIRRNTFRGAQSYGPFGVYVRPAFELRGTPAASASFHGNVVPHSSGLDQHTTPLGTLSSYGAVRLDGVSFLSLLQQKKLVITRNKYCVDTASELAVGDFNGDGRDDVFQAVGTLWVYSPSGSREWFVLNDSTLRLKSLRLGDFDGDGRTDVFTQSGDRWLVSYGGTGVLTPLPAGSSIGITQYRFGDFDGDGKTDVFRANGSQFFISSGGATAWIPLVPSGLGISALRFGDFDGDGTTDVFSLANSQWSVSYGGATAWVRLNRTLSSSLGSLVFADFDGDHRTDVARSSAGTWQVSWGGRTEWQTLQFGRPESLSVGVLFGDFTGDGHADVLQHGARRTLASIACWAVNNGTTTFESFKRFRLSSGGATTLQTWSSADIR